MLTDRAMSHVEFFFHGVFISGPDGVVNRISFKDFAKCLLFASLACTFCSSILAQSSSEITAEQMRLAQSIERHRIATIERVIGSVVAVYGLDRQGGGSGVIVDPSGIAITNHHVIAGAGIRGLGGLNDGQLYDWTLIGTDPGGDVAVIQLSGRETFPSSPLADSDRVRIGDWALAMGNPFLLAEDQTPTVTLGIVSGVQRFQPGAGANQLVYGNCIQVDSSINPGNSGGPLFNLAGEVIGINGRGSFQDRGRVNVGLGYAISSNQVKNFLPELLATKLTEHATLDAGFSERQGKVVCSRLDRESPIAQAGLRLKDELLEFEGVPITSANQFKNLICTLPEDWPTSLKIRKPEGDELVLRVRSYGLPYSKQPRTELLPPPAPPGDDDPDDDFDPDEEPDDPQQKKRAENLKREMVALLSAAPGSVRDVETNRKYATLIVDRWLQDDRVVPEPVDENAGEMCLKVVGITKRNDGKPTGRQTMWLAPDGRGRAERVQGESKLVYRFDSEKCIFQRAGNGKSDELSLSEARDTLYPLQAMVLVELVRDLPRREAIKAQNVKNDRTAFASFGNLLIEGAGKSNEQLAWRIKALDFDLDETYLWFSVATERSGLRPRLTKVANDKDGDAGAIRFEDWRPLGDGQFPYRFVHVQSLSEKESLRVEVESTEWVPVDSVDFELAEDDDHD